MTPRDEFPGARCIRSAQSSPRAPPHTQMSRPGPEGLGQLLNRLGPTAQLAPPASGKRATGPTCVLVLGQGRLIAGRSGVY